VADSIRLCSSAFANGGPIALKYAAADLGDNLSPPLEWDCIPPEAAEFALIVEDPDAPLPRPVVHAIAVGISPDEHCLEEGVLSSQPPLPICLGRGSFGRLGYSGPRPVLDHGPHRYHFQIIAVSRSLDFSEPPDRAQLLAAIGDCAIAKGRLIGVFERA
jgi:Raf kinase inhibitor-like YbhB/YbcL family protein